VGLPDEKPIVHFAWATAQLDELPVVGDGTSKNLDTASESWDATLGTRNTHSETADDGLASVHDSEMGL
jgi:hypothetical protein